MEGLVSSSLEPWNGGSSGSVKEEVDLPLNQSLDLDWWNAGSKEVQEEIKEEIKEEVMEGMCYDTFWEEEIKEEIKEQQLFTNLESKPMSF